MTTSPKSVSRAAADVAATRPHVAVLVEGRSDQAAIRALAAKRSRDLDAENVAVIALEGITNLRHYVTALGPAGAGVRLVGMYDEPEAGAVRRGLQLAGVAADDDLAKHGFHMCSRDLEDELLRALGVDEVLGIFERDDELERFRVFQRQPAQRGRPIEAHLHRFLGIRSGRKIRYGRLLVEALDVDRIPAPLDAVLADV